ncbi:pseudaminic acid biosynthesis N-acetyl transferase [Methanolobus tindarius DSM 2278]|uniref:Pseudaminic acid biosynthesis N-acetyl transferase n=1 Tax=Methanolobus tindarius DSM 2278 TaxID=1090322 RepID=W9DUV0_METTI|nr:UDP-4-amino-4,6-dideoxy-N-acetyl-beta-L-altrosamine N-acetyltransferase [Methanolobus tindarius]ETA67462.1 pseudaminic acid biosynthesis N-acetyl transferase [Methanolobus tindarius DSM 2278]
MDDLKNDFTFDDILVTNFVNVSSEEKEMIRTFRNHDTIKKWMYNDKDITREEHFNFIKMLKHDNHNNYWIVKKGVQYIGVISLKGINRRHKNAYIGIYTNPYTEIKGKGSLLIQCIKKIAFDISNLHTLKLEVMCDNQRAISFYQRAGFTEEGRLKEFVFKNNKWYDMIIMGIINGEVISAN